jgi:hypothetical protein
MDILDVVRGEFEDAVGPKRNTQEENQPFGASYIMYAWKLYKSREV